MMLNPREAAAALGVVPGTLNHWRMAGKGPAFLRVGRLIKYRSEDLTAWLDARRVSPEERSHGTEQHAAS